MFRKPIHKLSKSGLKARKARILQMHTSESKKQAEASKPNTSTFSSIPEQANPPQRSGSSTLPKVTTKNHALEGTKDLVSTLAKHETDESASTGGQEARRSDTVRGEHVTIQGFKVVAVQTKDGGTKFFIPLDEIATYVNPEIKALFEEIHVNQTLILQYLREISQKVDSILAKSK